MLSRVADAIYWMSRYAERAENVARFVEANFYLTLDLPDGSQNQWLPLVSVTGDEALYLDRYERGDPERVLDFLLFDSEYWNSAFSCLNRARENARSVREIISTDMWEQINSAYHFINEAARSEPRAAIFRNPYDFCRQLRTAVTLFAGLAHDTMSQGETLQFFRLGRMLERADKTSRILDIKYFVILPSVEAVGTAEDDLQWSALLGSTSALEAYRQAVGELRPRSVVAFLILDRSFPRAIRFCLLKADAALRRISGTPPGSFVNPVERALGRVCAELNYASVDDILTFGLHEYLDDLQVDMNVVDEEICSTFFSRDSSSEDVEIGRATSPPAPAPEISPRRPAERVAR